MKIFYPVGAPEKGKARPGMSGLMVRGIAAMVPFLMLPMLQFGFLRHGWKLMVLVFTFLPPALLWLGFRRENQTKNPDILFFLLNEENQLLVLPSQHYYGMEVREQDVWDLLEKGRDQYGTLPKGTGEILRTLTLRENSRGCTARCMVRTDGRVRVRTLKIGRNYQDYSLLAEQFELRTQ